MPRKPLKATKRHYPVSKDRRQELARLSFLAYEGEDCRDCPSFRKAVRKQGLKDKYEVIKDLSDPDHVTFRDKSSGQATIAFRGTRLGNTRDLWSDAAILFGFQQYTSRFKSAERVTQKAIDRFGKGNVAVTGHSLGGTQAIHAAHKHGVETHAFNPGAGLPKFMFGLGGLLAHLGDKLGSRAKKERTHVYTTGIDPISNFSKFTPNSNHHFVAPNQLDVHGIKNFF